MPQNLNLRSITAVMFLRLFLPFGDYSSLVVITAPGFGFKNRIQLLQ